jgi:hypothetical protein
LSMAAACACQPPFWVNDASAPVTGMPASKCAVSSTLAPFCPKADPQTPATASASATWQIGRRFRSPKEFLGLIGVLLPHSQPMSKTRIILTRRRTTEFVKVFAAKKHVRTGLETKIDILANNIFQRFRIKSGGFIGLLAVSPPRNLRAWFDSDLFLP